MAGGSLHPVDWVMVGLYFAVTFSIALWVRSGQRTATDFFLAGRSMPWMVVGVSMFATLFSTNSFVGVPGEAYRSGVMLYLNSLGYCLFTPLAVWLFLRFFYTSGESFTAYEYLERRFGPTTRTLGAAAFMFGRALYAASVLFAASRVFETLLGWDAVTVILVVGTFSILYTGIGGMRAVMITDVLQTLVLLAGVAAIVIKLSWLIGFDYGAVWRYADQHGHGFDHAGSAEFFVFDPYVRFTFWVWLTLAVMNPLQDYSSDQLVVQRLLASKNYRAAKQAIWLKTLMAPLVMAAFYGMGLLLFYYYRTDGTLPEQLPADQILGWFVREHLPPPLPGLIAAAVLAALMSTMDSTINSLSTVTCVDLLERLGARLGRADREVAAGRWLTFAWGGLILGVALALTVAGRRAEAHVIELSGLYAALPAVLMVVMIGGVLTRWATARAATAALAVGLPINLVLPSWLYFGAPAAERISYAWVGMPGVIATAVTLVVVSVLDPKKPQRLEGLVHGAAKGE